MNDKTVPIICGPVTGRITTTTGPESVVLLEIALDATPAGDLSYIEWFEPLVEITTVWTPTGDTSKGLDYEWDQGRTSRNVDGAPVFSFVGPDDCARLTVAVDQTLLPVRIRHGVREEDGTAHIRIYPTCPAFTVRVDRRRLPLADALVEVTAWWDERRRHPILQVPPVAYRAFYSTWYSLHQDFNEESLRAECRRAADLGMAGIIIDDGWQTDDSSRGYSTCGDWRVHPAKITDMAAFVAAAHEMNLRVLLWFSVPFVGHESDAYQRLEQYALRRTTDHAWEQHDRSWIVIDPRFPEARESFVQSIVHAVVEWNLDGLKLDFVDEFSEDASSSAYDPAKMDVTTLEEGADKLLFAVREAVGALRPDALIEFRQRYVGPEMRAYGNVFRANDCPNNALVNRIRTVDLRLLSGSTAVHSDMIMWHRRDSFESAALQFVAVLFAVPQVSVRLADLPAEQEEMVRWWLSVFDRYRPILQHAPISVGGVDSNYSRVEAASSDTRFVCLYAERLLEIHATDGIREEIVMVNGAAARRIAVSATTSPSAWRGIIQDARGGEAGTVVVQAGATESITVPTAGMVVLRRSGQSR
jgi:alpha-galactosidase